LYPGLAVAEWVRRIQPSAKVVFACSQRRLDRRILERTGHAFAAQPIRPLPRGRRGWWSFATGWWGSMRLAKDMIRDLKPAAVLGLGGFAAVPLVRQAARSDVRVAILNPDAVPGLANRHLAAAADVIFTQFAETTEHFAPQHRHKVRQVGCPVRREVLIADRDQAIEHFRLESALRTLLVVGGSSGARSINAAVERLEPRLEDVLGWQMIWITGPGRQRASCSDRFAAMPLRQMDYCDRMDLAYAAADLIVARAGAVTVAEVAATGTPAVFMPYPHHRDEHQYHNAAGLATAGSAAIVKDLIDPDSNARSLGGVLLDLMQDRARLDRMAEAAKRRARPDAAEKVAEWICGRGSDLIG